MTRRTPARLLAPLALVAVAVALYAVLAGVASDRPAPGSPPATASPAPASTAGKRGGRSGSRGPRTYTVKPGDTPSGIAEKTGVTVERLLELNPDVSANSLSPGTKLKLR